MMAARKKSIAVTVGQLAPSFKGMILDIFGVIHDGTKLFPPVGQTLRRLRANGMRICLLSNAPRRAAKVESRLVELGLGPDCYDGLVTSGELVYHALSGVLSIPMPSGLRYFHAGPDELATLMDGLVHSKVGNVNDADFILATGDDDGSWIDEACVRRISMVCANPDREVILDGRRIRCAGALADRYEAIGGIVFRLGKPQLPAYDRALAVLDLPCSEVIAIGDSLATDIVGASQAGLASALVLSGIHYDEVHYRDRLSWAKLHNLFKTHEAVPTYLLGQFSWD
jgi:HAD superfamily hydrolase (TIGR01459 family)